MGDQDPDRRLIDTIVAHMPGMSRLQASHVLEHDDVRQAAVALEAMSVAGPEPDPSGAMLFGYRLHSLAAAVLTALRADGELVERARQLAAHHEHELARHLEVSLSESAVDLDD